ncbi:phosphoribosyltransferase family protein [Arthrobacter sp. Y-9]|uniref:ComF family protein n=1 Tax=Arthrobacter sp. Y-9 TaxID=3039385 RepID=UPI00241D9F1D|nr:phosphoribosyltransferase family protein [Arthrobacter sp. Y-9]WFR83115.1 phosphoribosyltransferase family protein [Arthrobacter sp. Y-9]
MASLVTGAECAACGLPEVMLCPACRRELHRHGLAPFPVGDRAPALAGRPDWTVLTAADYAGVLSQVILTQKRLGHRELSRELGALLHRAIWAFPRGAAPATGRQEAPRPMWLVPVPGSGASFRTRGFDPLALVVRCAAAAGLPTDCGMMPALAVRGVSERVARAAVRGARPRHDGNQAPVLKRVGRALRKTLPRPGNGQKGLGASARRARLSGSMRLSRAFRVVHRADALKGADCVLVDDVLTTGATLDEAGRVLEEAGARVLGAVVLAAARPPSDRGSSQEEISEQGMNY